MKHFHWSIRGLIAIALLAGLSSTQAQQQPSATGPAGQSVKGAQLKNKAPINERTLKIHLPKAAEARLSNGLGVVLIEDKKLPTLFMQIVLLQRGDSADPKGQQGLARATLTQLRQGTTSRSAREISEQLDALGASVSGFTSTLDGYVIASGLSEHADPILAILADVILHPTFPQNELDLYKNRLISQLQAQRVQPGFMARETFSKAVYGDHPASVVAPADEDIKRLATADLKSYHDRYVRPNNAIMLVSGDITMPALIAKLEKVFADWKPNDEQPKPLPDVNTGKRGKVFVVDRPGSVQTSLLMGGLAIRGDDPDRDALNVMNEVLGGSPASRLFTNLREDKGLTYGAYSGFSAPRYLGTVVANAEVRTEVTGEAMKEFMYELKRIATEPVSAVELANAKRALVGRFALGLEEPRSFLGYVFEQKVLALPKDYWDHYSERIDAITAADIQRVAKKYLDLGKLQIVAVGDASKIGEVMKTYESDAPK